MFFVLFNIDIFGYKLFEISPEEDFKDIEHSLQIVYN